MKILAFLQNQYFKNPEKVREIYARRPNHRNKLIASFLFAGCLTGRRLRESLGPELCSAIIWEEASREIGGHSGSVFEPDLEHIRQSISDHAPDLILCFGKVAGNALKQLHLAQPIIYGPHPASRQNAMVGLIEMKADVIRRMSPAQ